MSVDAQRTAANRKSQKVASDSLFYNPKVRAAFSQIFLVILVFWLGYEIVTNTVANLEKQGIRRGFDFLDQTAGFGVNQTLIEYSEESSYGRAFVIGLLNTLLVASLGVILATVLGFGIGVARLSKNWVISSMAAVYVEVMRNIPLLLHIFIWYFAVLRTMPGKRDKWSLFDVAHVNIFGFWGPKPVFHDGFWMTGLTIASAFVASFLVYKWSKRRQTNTGKQFPVFLTSLGLIVGLPLLVLLATGTPMSWELPVFKTDGPMLRRGFQNGIGIRVIPEFIALFLALSIYTAAYIAEIVRSGILAVSHGQTEAANALGLRPGPTLRLVVIPQALRVIIPPLTNQYLNLTKNSSLAAAIAYPDLVSVFAGIVLNQTGQAIEVLLITMGVYLLISIVTSIVMNWYNARIALVER